MSRWLLLNGFRVEWPEFEDYLAFMHYYEGAAAQGDVLIQLHAMHTALLFLGLCTSNRGRALQVQAMAPEVSVGSIGADTTYGVSLDVVDSTATGADTFQEVLVIYSPHTDNGSNVFIGGHAYRNPVGL